MVKFLPVDEADDTWEPLPVLPHRQPGVALAEAEALAQSLVLARETAATHPEAGHPDHGPAYAALEQEIRRQDEAAAHAATEPEEGSE